MPTASIQTQLALAIAALGGAGALLALFLQRTERLRTAAETALSAERAVAQELAAAKRELRQAQAQLALQKQQQQQQQQQPEALTCNPVGVVRSVYAGRNFTPNQPSRVPAAIGRVDLLAPLQGCLDDLDKFSHVWILFHFHDNTAASSAKGKILPPRKPDRLKVGVFSCRSPNRPNPVGLSLVKLDRVDRARHQVFFSGHDLLDGTPVIDIKPYIPAHDQPLGSVQLPSWVADSSELAPDFDTVELAPLVREKLAKMDLSKSLFPDATAFEAFLTQVLQWDGRKRHVREEHAATGGGQWIFEVRPRLDFILEFPAPGVVRCVNVLPKGTLRHVKGQGLVSVKDLARRSQAN